jgi:hypothetical protein
MHETIVMHMDGLEDRWEWECKKCPTSDYGFTTRDKAEDSAWQHEVSAAVNDMKTRGY